MKLVVVKFEDTVDITPLALGVAVQIVKDAIVLDGKIFTYLPIENPTLLSHTHPMPAGTTGKPIKEA